MKCATCQRRRRFVVSVSSSPYYAPIVTCCGCGDSWEDGFQLERPFARGWRESSIARAKKDWDAATLTKAEIRAEYEEMERRYGL